MFSEGIPDPNHSAANTGQQQFSQPGGQNLQFGSAPHDPSSTPGDQVTPPFGFGSAEGGSPSNIGSGDGAAGSLTGLPAGSDWNSPIHEHLAFGFYSPPPPQQSQQPQQFHHLQQTPTTSHHNLGANPNPHDQQSRAVLANATTDPALRGVRAAGAAANQPQPNYLSSAADGSLLQGTEAVPRVMPSPSAWQAATTSPENHTNLFALPECDQDSSSTVQPPNQTQAGPPFSQASFLDNPQQQQQQQIAASQHAYPSNKNNNTNNNNATATTTTSANSAGATVKSESHRAPRNSDKIGDDDGWDGLSGPYGIDPNAGSLYQLTNSGWGQDQTQTQTQNPGGQDPQHAQSSQEDFGLLTQGFADPTQLTQQAQQAQQQVPQGQQGQEESRYQVSGYSPQTYQQGYFVPGLQGQPQGFQQFLGAPHTSRPRRSAQFDTPQPQGRSSNYLQNQRRVYHPSSNSLSGSGSPVAHNRSTDTIAEQARALINQNLGSQQFQVQQQQGFVTSRGGASFTANSISTANPVVLQQQQQHHHQHQHRSRRTSLPQNQLNPNSAPAIRQRPAMTGARNKRPVEEGQPGGNEATPEQAKVKIPRAEKPSKESDFSSSVRARMQTYTRTGQACDRCKVRKIRCDALPDGCSHCLNSNVDCLVTDRVTGRTEPRGYTPMLEKKLVDMTDYIDVLEGIMRSAGMEVRPSKWTQELYEERAKQNGSHFEMPDTTARGWQEFGPVAVRGLEPKAPAPAPERLMLDPRASNSYLGLAEDSAPLCAIRGTTLTILGKTIDIASFAAPDVDEPPPETLGARDALYNKSVQSFLRSTMNVNRNTDVPLPARDEAFDYAARYFQSISPFLPLLHEQTFMKLLTGIYDENAKASIPELVIAHMVYACIYAQTGLRGWDDKYDRDEYERRSNLHYHFSLSKFYELSSSYTLESVQAMAMIAVHTRSFPKPGAGSLVANFALQRAIELGYHRKAQRHDNATDLDTEMRKRVWWTILCLYITLNGRLGRPMPIDLKEFDVDFPAPISDKLLAEAVHGNVVPLSKAGECEYQVGLAAFKIVPLFMEMYSSLYCVWRDPSDYDHVIHSLETKLERWKEGLHESVRYDRVPPTAPVQARVFALYTEAFALEFRLCLRHPSVALTKDAKTISDNTHICEETASQMLLVVQEMLKHNILDTTWYQMSVYAAAIFSTLAASFERRGAASAEEIAKLQVDMNRWINVLKATANQVGCGPSISTEIVKIIDRTIGLIRGAADESRRERNASLAAGEDPSSGGRHQASAMAQAALKQEPSDPSPTQSGAAPSNGVPGGASRSYYPDASVNGTQYPGGLNYPEQTQPGMQPQDYPATPEYYASGQPQPPLEFPGPGVSQPSQPDPMMWTQPAVNAWDSYWTAVTGAPNQEAYASTALVAMQHGGAVPDGSRVNPDGQPGPQGDVPMGGQWPVL